MSEIDTFLSDKTLTMFVGPSAAGKSTIMEEVVRQDEKFAYVRTFTTRDPRPGEKSHYRHITPEQANLIYRDNEYITFAKHPTTHTIYGTDKESYPKTHNLLDTLSVSVKDFRAAQFMRTITLGVAADAEDWRGWFTDRYPTPTHEAQNRLDEARISLEWALNDPETHWLVNRNGSLQDVARLAISLTSHQPKERIIPDEPRAMLELIDKGLWS